MNVQKGRKGFQKVTDSSLEIEIVNLYLETDKPLHEIAETFGISVPTVNRIARKHGLSGIRRPLISKDTKRQIIDFYLSGNNQLVTAVDFGVHEDTVRNILKSFRISRRSRLENA